MRTVNEVSRFTGVSVRTLHHYDQIGLLKPTEVTPAGYRLYADGGEFTANIDRASGAGTADFVRRAIEVYCIRIKGGIWKKKGRMAQNRLQKLRKCKNTTKTAFRPLKLQRNRDNFRFCTKKYSCFY